MRKVFFILALMIFSSLGYSQSKNFVVVFKDSFEEPIRKNQTRNPNRQMQANQNAGKRTEKLSKVDNFLRQKNIAPGKAKKFVDGAVGFVANLNSSQV
nr:hypothetical protein [Algoriphagus sp.]